MRRTLAIVALATSLVSFTHAAENAILVLDASGSMWGQLNGKTKIEIARAAVADLTTAWPAGSNLGLVTYGHRSKGDCNDIETLLPPAALDRATYLSKVNALNPKGMTPISAAVIHAAEALKFSEQKATVILVSDGEETCERDPCQVGLDLEKRGVDFVAHVIGFDVPNPKHQDQLKCLAESTGGRYFNARDAADLSGALKTLASSSAAPQLPAASATLKAPPSSAILGAINVSWTGPGDRGDYIVLARKSAASYTDYDFATLELGKNTVQLNAPAAPGEYFLRYMSLQRAQPVLAEIPIKVTDLQASLDAPASVEISQRVKIRARGPFDSGTWVGFASKDSPASSYLSFRSISAADSELELIAPANAGSYELRYVLSGSERILISKAIEVTEGEAQIEAPSTANSGDVINFTARGPVDTRNWIGFAAKGSPISSYVDYVRPSEQSTSVQLSAPAQPGDYEIRYVLNEDQRILASHPIKIVDGPVQLDVPATVTAGSEVTITSAGPASAKNWIGFAPQGSEPGAYLDYVEVNAATMSFELTAPKEPGQYELRYVLDSKRILLSKPVTVTR